MMQYININNIVKKYENINYTAKDCFVLDFGL